MYRKENFLIEMGTEELPPKAVKWLSEAFAAGLSEQLTKGNFNFGRIKTFATPRRIAVLIHQIDTTAADKIIERKGPALSAAINENNSPTLAGSGFARSCGVDFEKLEIQKTAEGSWLIYRHQEKGQSFTDVAASMVSAALKGLLLGKTMRWNELEIEFLRPVHWVVLLYGSQLICAEILGVASDRRTFGHPFHCPQALFIDSADQYESLLENEGYVIPDFAKRRALILQQIQTIGKKQNASAVFDEALLDEVTGLVEWPVPFVATYAEDFLTLPKEVLISAIEHHQKCFPVENHKGELMPCFMTISNIRSIHPEQIITGNERVMRARLSDAAFFFYTDKKHSLESRLEELKKVTFQAKLGTLFDKANRLSYLCAFIAEYWQIDSIDSSDSARAGLLAKTDLMTQMVHEFPELQGVMGYYYAQHDGEKNDVCTAIYEHYLPKVSGDKLPTTQAGWALAIADRMDNLVGIFSLGQIPSGDKDPFGLKRAAIGILRILIEKELPLSLEKLIETSIQSYANLIQESNFTRELKDFIIERLRAWYNEKEISTDIFNAVVSVENNEPLDIHRRIMAVKSFCHLPEAQALTFANKRVSHILEQAEFTRAEYFSDPDLFQTDAEKTLYRQIEALNQASDKDECHYTARLTEFAKLQTPLDHFFDEVMVMVPDIEQRNNRLQLLAQLRNLFLQVADISLLSSQKTGQ